MEKKKKKKEQEKQLIDLPVSLQVRRRTTEEGKSGIATKIAVFVNNLQKRLHPFLLPRLSARERERERESKVPSHETKDPPKMLMYRM